MIGHPPPLSAAGSHLEELPGLGQDQLAIETLGGQEADLTRAGIQLVQAMEGAVLAVSRPVVAVVTKGHDLVAALDLRHEGRGLQRTVQQSIGLADLQTRLLDIVAVVVLDGHQLQHQCLVAEGLRLLAVRSLQCVVQA